MPRGIRTVPKIQRRRIVLELTAEDELLIDQHVASRLIEYLDVDEARIGVIRTAMRLGLGVGQPPEKK